MLTDVVARRRSDGVRLLAEGRPDEVDRVVDGLVARRVAIQPAAQNLLVLHSEVDAERHKDGNEEEDAAEEGEEEHGGRRGWRRTAHRTAADGKDIDE